MHASRISIGRRAPWYVPAWYNSVRAFREILPPNRKRAAVFVPADRFPSCPTVRIDPETPDADEPQAWEVRMPDGSAEWFYNYLGAITEAAARGMRLPVESDWSAADPSRSPALPAVPGIFPGIWLPSPGRLEYRGSAAVSWMDYSGRWPIDFTA